MQQIVCWQSWFHIDMIPSISSIPTIHPVLDITQFSNCWQGWKVYIKNGTVHRKWTILISIHHKKQYENRMKNELNNFDPINYMICFCLVSLQNPLWRVMSSQLSDRTTLQYIPCAVSALCTQGHVIPKRSSRFPTLQVTLSLGSPCRLHLGHRGPQPGGIKTEIKCLYSI